MANPRFVYSWKLEPTDPLPVGKKPCLSLRELEKQIGYDLDQPLDPLRKRKMAVDDDLLQKNPFGFQLVGVVINDTNKSHQDQCGNP